MSYKDYFRAAVTLTAVVASSTALDAQARPRVGAEAADARAVDVEGVRVLSTKALEGKPIVIVYEDKDSATLNASVKSDLAAMMKDDATRAAVVVAAVADVSEYDSWPAKGFVKDAIREESKKSGTTISKFLPLACFSRSPNCTAWVSELTMSLP